MFKLESLPAYEGDCLILSWGEGSIHRILIDGGRSQTASKVLNYAKTHNLNRGAFELFIVTHIDRDHIEGAVKLLENKDFCELIKEIWFNDRSNLNYTPEKSEFEMFGALDGERLTNLIRDHQVPKNLSFQKKPIAVLGDTLPTIKLIGGLTLTVLSPDIQQLEALAKPWDDTIDKAPDGWEHLGGSTPIDLSFLAKSRFKSDTTRPNGSSIAIAAEYQGEHVLLTGDAHVKRLIESLRLYQLKHPQLTGFSVVKASHHGSQGNTSNELVETLKCRNWVFSTNGNYFKHPDQEAIARIITRSPKNTNLYFNYETEFTTPWRTSENNLYKFNTYYGADGYIAVDILP